MSSIDYHLSELEIAKDLNNKSRNLPTILPIDKVIMDIGCGIGQTFLALECTDRKCIGIDVDDEAIAYGIEHYGDVIDFFRADATEIPCPSNNVDLIFSRVALPYTDIPLVIKEIKRVLNDNGRIWLTLHSKILVKSWLKAAIKERNIKDIIHKSYVLLNGYLLSYFGFLLPFITGKYESWQGAKAIIGLLNKNGIDAHEVRMGGQLIIEGRIKPVNV